MYSAYEYCDDPDCRCDHRGGVWRAHHVSLVEAYRSLHRHHGYRSVVVRDDGPEREVHPRP